MTNVFLCGALGRMGKKITELAQSMEDAQITAGFDIADGNAPYPIYKNYDAVQEEINVIIDFSHPSNFDGVLAFAKKKHVPLILCTTGLSEEQKQQMYDASSEIPVFYSANMSLGINLLIALAKKAANVLGTDFDIEILEKHHNKKLDAPSGTALAIADALKETRETESEYVYERHSVRKMRENKEIGISAIRGGTIVGEHDVFFCGPDEVITLSHSAASRDVFAHGALRSAVFMKGKPNGFYSMNDFFEQKM